MFQMAPQPIGLRLSLGAICLVFAALLALAFNLSSGQQQRHSKQAVNCSNIAEVLDRCGALASYSHTIPRSAYPASLDELKEACPRHNEGLHCLRQHVRCLKPLTKRAILSFIESRRKHVKKLCSDPKGQAARDFTEAFACIRKFKREKFVDSEIKAIKRIDAILSDQVKDFRERFQRSCCSISSYRQRTVDDMGPECSKPHLIGAVESAIDSVVGEAIEFACPDAKSSICTSMKELNLSKLPSNKTLTRAGTDLMIVLTAPEDPAASSSGSSGAINQSRQPWRPSSGFQMANHGPEQPVTRPTRSNNGSRLKRETEKSGQTEARSRESGEPSGANHNLMLINEAIKRILLDILIRGHGDRLIGRWSREPSIQRFLDQVPYLLDRINQFHLICSLGSLTGLGKGACSCVARRRFKSCQHGKTRQASTRSSSSHKHPRPPDQFDNLDSLHSLMGLIGDQHHWLARTRDPLGLTPLHKAVLATNRPIVEYLVDRYGDERAPLGAPAGLLALSSLEDNFAGPQAKIIKPQPGRQRLIDAQDKYGRTALHYAAALVAHQSPSGGGCCAMRRNESMQVYQFLLSKGADESLRDFRGKLAHDYRRRPDQARAKCIIQLACKMGAQYQATVFTRTLKTMGKFAEIHCRPTSDQLLDDTRAQLNDNYAPNCKQIFDLEESVLLPAQNRASMSMSCADLNANNYGENVALRTRCESFSYGAHRLALNNYNPQRDEELIHLASEATGLVTASNQLSAVKSKRPSCSSLATENNQFDSSSSSSINFTNLSGKTDPTAAPSARQFTTAINLSSPSSSSIKPEQQKALKQLYNDRCDRLVLNEKSRQLIRRSLIDGNIEQINELLVAGYGQSLVELAPVACWNLRCRHYIDKCVMNFLKFLDKLHELIALNAEPDQITDLLINEPILARINRPYKKASLNCLHLATKMNRKTIVQLLINKFPELLSSKDSNGATCLHWAAKSLQNDRLYNWLSEHFGAQLENVYDFRGKTAADYRQQAIKLASFEQLHPLEEEQQQRAMVVVAPSVKKLQSAGNVESILAESQANQDRLQLVGSKSSLLKRNGKQNRSFYTKNLLATHGHQSKSSRDASSLLSGGQTISSRRLASAAENSNQASAVLVINANAISGNESETVRKISTNEGQTSGERLESPADQQATDQQLDRILDNNLVPFECPVGEQTPTDLGVSGSAIEGADGPKRKLDDLISASIQANDFKKLQHLVLAGCGRRILAAYARLGSLGPNIKQQQEEGTNGHPGSQISAAMRQFLERNVVQCLKTIELIHETIHKCFSYHQTQEQITSADSIGSNNCGKPMGHQSETTGDQDLRQQLAKSEQLANSSFHRLCSLFASKSLMMARDRFGASALHVALIRCDKRLIDYLLSRNPAIASGPDKTNRNALHYATIVVSAWRQHGDFKLTYAPTQSSDSSSPDSSGCSAVIGFWMVDKTCELIHEQLVARFGNELLGERDKFGKTSADYLVDEGQGQLLGLHQLPSRPMGAQVLHACCPEYVALLQRYQYRIWTEGGQLEVELDVSGPGDGAPPSSGFPDSSHELKEPTEPTISTATSSTSASTSASMSSSSSSSSSTSSPPLATETTRDHIEDSACNESTLPPATSATESPMADCSLEQPDEWQQLAGSNESGCSQPQDGHDKPAAMQASASKDMQLVGPHLEPQTVANSGSFRRSRSARKHRHDRRSKRHRRYKRHHESQSVVGGIIVPTIIHNDNRDEIEAYDIIYRQPPPISSSMVSLQSPASPAASRSANNTSACSLSNSSSSISLGSLISLSSSDVSISPPSSLSPVPPPPSPSLTRLADCRPPTATSGDPYESHLLASTGQQLEQMATQNQARRPPTRGNQSQVCGPRLRLGPSRQASLNKCLGEDNDDDDDDEHENDERVERLSNEFEERVRREKSELRSKVDQIMREIKSSAKSDKSARFLASPNDLLGLSSSSDSRGGLANLRGSQLVASGGDKRNLIASRNTNRSQPPPGPSSVSSASSLSSSVATNKNYCSPGQITANSSEAAKGNPSNSAHGKKQPKQGLRSLNKGSPLAGDGDNKFEHLGDLAGQLVSKNTYGQTYLHFIASRSQNGSTFYKVLDHSIHLISERDIFYRTARDVAIQFNLTNNVQVLDKFVIDLFINNKTNRLWLLLKQGYSPLIHVSDADGNDIMLILKLLKLDRMVQQLLRMADFQRWRDELHTFIRHGYSAGVSELIRRHKDLVGAKSVHSRTSLHLAVLFDRLEMIEELMEADKSSVQATDNMGRSPLHYVFGLHQKNGELIRDKLIEYGANIEARDVRMRTPKYYYIFRREIEEILRIELEIN